MYISFPQTLWCSQWSTFTQNSLNWWNTFTVIFSAMSQTSGIGKCFPKINNSPRQVKHVGKIKPKTIGKYIPGSLVESVNSNRCFPVCHVASVFQCWRRDEVTREMLSHVEGAVKYINSTLMWQDVLPSCPTPMDTSTPRDTQSVYPLTWNWLKLLFGQFINAYSRTQMSLS